MGFGTSTGTRRTQDLNTTKKYQAQEENGFNTGELMPRKILVQQTRNQRTLPKDQGASRPVPPNFYKKYHHTRTKITPQAKSS